MPETTNIIEFSLVEKVCYLKTSPACTHIVAPDLTSFVENLCANHCALDIRFLLTQTEYMDSTIMGTLLSIYQQCQESDGGATFTLVNPSVKAMGHLTTMGLDAVLEVQEGVDVPDDLDYGIIDGSMISTLSREEFVLEAHQKLSNLNDGNKKQFKLLIDSLSADIERKKNT